MHGNNKQYPPSSNLGQKKPFPQEVSLGVRFLFSKNDDRQPGQCIIKTMLAHRNRKSCIVSTSSLELVTCLEPAVQVSQWAFSMVHSSELLHIQNTEYSEYDRYCCHPFNNCMISFQYESCIWGEEAEAERECLLKVTQ